MGNVMKLFVINIPVCKIINIIKIKFFLAGYSSCYTNLIFYTKQFIFNANMFQQTASAIIRADL